MGLILTLLGILVVLVLIAFVVGFFIPDYVSIKRETLIRAPRETVFALIGDFTQWHKWSPWAARDPEAKYTFEGQGVGQMMSWTSEKKDVGSGSQRITDFDPPARVESDLNFGKMGVAHATFDLSEPEPGKTLVVWGFESNMRQGVPVLMQPMAAYMGFMMEKWLAPDYEQGLASLKRAAEAEAGVPASAEVVNIQGGDPTS